MRQRFPTPEKCKKINCSLKADANSPNYDLHTIRLFELRYFWMLTSFFLYSLSYTTQYWSIFPYNTNQNLFSIHNKYITLCVSVCLCIICNEKVRWWFLHKGTFEPPPPYYLNKFKTKCVFGGEGGGRCWWLFCAKPLQMSKPCEGILYPI